MKNNANSVKDMVSIYISPNRGSVVAEHPFYIYDSDWELIDMSNLGFDKKVVEDWYKKNKYFCSEAVMEMLGFFKPDTFTPASMYIIFKRLSELKNNRNGK